MKTALQGWNRNIFALPELVELIMTYLTLEEKLRQRRVSRLFNTLITALIRELSPVPLGLDDVGLSSLTNLRILQFTETTASKESRWTLLKTPFNRGISDAGLVTLQCLTWLDLGMDNKTVSDRGLSVLTNLTTLKLRSVDGVSDAGLHTLTRLTSLELSNCKKVTDASLTHLTNLTDLRLGTTQNMTDTGLCHQTSLTRLSLVGGTFFTNESIRCLTRLTELTRYCNPRIDDIGIQGLTNLTSLRTDGVPILSTPYIDTLYWTRACRYRHTDYQRKIHTDQSTRTDSVWGRVLIRTGIDL
jgi:hypothetical protein